MRDKHSALMRPVVFALDHVCSITVVPAETPHEMWFQQSYGNAIITALERLRNPANPANPASSWQPFKQVSALMFCFVFLNPLLQFIKLLCSVRKQSLLIWPQQLV